jgi:hypothetical protein
MVAEYATKDDLAELRRDLRETERILRERDEQKERQLRAEFVDAVRHSDERTDRHFRDLETHLDRQDEFIMRRRFTWSTWRRDVARFAAASVVATLVLHFLFGVAL